MENPQPVKDKPRSRRIWFIIAGFVLACCLIVAIGAVFAGSAVSSALQGFMGTPGAEPITTALPSDQGLNAASTEAPSAGPVAGGRGDQVLKTDVWNSILGAYASNKDCADVTSTKIEVTQVPDSSGVWRENWTGLACGRTEVLKVKFTPSTQDGTDYSITQ